MANKALFICDTDIVKRHMHMHKEYNNMQHTQPP